MRLALDPSLRLYRGGRVLVAHGRIIRLTDAGPAALRALLAGTPTPAQRRLGDRLVEAGMAHPRPTPRTLAATVVIPVRDRPADLARCLERSQSEGLKGTVPLSVVVVDDGSVEAGAIAAVADRYGARLVRRARSGGPGVARNDGVREVETEFVAFLDSDTVPPPGWIDGLAGHFDDPRVAAVAPRIRALGGGRSPLDMGPGRKVAYVPSAALVVRRGALPVDPFDPALRYGEDVDLIWRLQDAGWRVRYEPDVVVYHEECDRLRRRFRYGTSAAPLAQRHPGRIGHIVLRPWPAATLLLLAARRPRTAALAYAAQTFLLARRLRAKGVPARLAPLWTARSLGQSVAQFARLATPYGAGVIYGRIRETTSAPIHL